jgi:hypothetical protein
MDKILVTNNITGEVAEIEQETYIAAGQTELTTTEPTLEERLQATEEALLTLLSMGVV